VGAFGDILPGVPRAVDEVGGVGGRSMDETAASEIEKIRIRLGEIQSERQQLAESDDERRKELLDEEHKLQNRLTGLEDRLAEEDTGEAEEEAARQTDLTQTPNLPDSNDEP
jgi:predicted nuclease with TOPRIM domain